MKQIKTLIKQHIPYYLTGTVILLTMKLFAKSADADALRFLLAPVSFGVSLISGVPFLWEPHTGYVSHDLRFLIAASCSGFNFMLITIGMLFFSFLHRISVHKYCGMLWLLLCMIFSYTYTILTNIVRILIAIYLPLYVEKQSLIPALFSPNTLHMLIGTIVYSSSLFILYSLVDKGISRLFRRRPNWQSNYNFALPKSPAKIPLCWYVGIVWGLPFVSRILHWEFAGFGRYTMIVFGSCLIIYFLKELICNISIAKHSD